MCGAEWPTRYSLNEKKQNDMEKLNNVGSETRSRYRRRSLMRTSLEVLFQALKQSGPISIKKKFEDGSELHCMILPENNEIDPCSVISDLITGTNNDTERKV